MTFLSGDSSIMSHNTIIKLTVFKVSGEINTDDLSPAPDAWSRPDIPLHALAMFKMPRSGLSDPLETIDKLKEKGNPLVFVGKVLETFWICVFHFFGQCGDPLRLS